MKLLLSCVNSPLSLIGYDWDKDEIFWTCNSTKACGIAYDGNGLLIATDNILNRLSPTNCNRTQMFGHHATLAHSVHVIDENLIGLVDTGNSQLLVINKKGKVKTIYNPVSHWGTLPPDAIHLNDFVVTPHGILASCFDYRPYQKVKNEVSWDKWSKGGYGVILSLTGEEGNGMGRIVGCGFNQPHSLQYTEPNLYVCSSSIGVLHVCEFVNGGLLREKMQYKITDDHFLRGAYKVNNEIFLGGSSRRYGEAIASSMEIYNLDELSGKVMKKSLGLEGEIYDILSWKNYIMQPLINHHFSTEKNAKCVAA